MRTMSETMLTILREASSAILEIYADVGKFQTEIKPDDSPLTAADKRSNQIIIKRLNENYPNIPVISEESKQVPYVVRSKYDHYFLVDPLDGTKEFIKRNGEFTINIAYMFGHHPIGGFVYVPCSDLGYVAEKAKGVYCINRKNENIRLRSLPFYL